MDAWIRLRGWIASRRPVKYGQTEDDEMRLNGFGDAPMSEEHNDAHDEVGYMDSMYRATTTGGTERNGGDRRKREQSGLVQRGLHLGIHVGQRDKEREREPTRRGEAREKQIEVKAKAKPRRTKRSQAIRQRTHSATCCCSRLNRSRKALKSSASGSTSRVFPGSARAAYASEL